MADILKTYGDYVVSTMYPGREANLPQILANMQKKTEDLIADLGF